MAEVLGIYIHIPFCKSKCDYCDFYSIAGQEQAVMDRYQSALLAQLQAFLPRLKGRSVDSIYFGGGTPSYYGDKRLREILLLLRRKLTVSRQAEITVECNPDSVDPRAIARLRRAGVNRISLGMQSADPEILCCLHRPHTPDQTVQAVADIRAAGIKNLSLDLIYGLPGQTMAGWEETLATAISLNPDHLSCYGLKVEERTPLALRVARGEVLPDEDAQADFYLQAVATLQKAGYRQYEISNFARTGMESRHNLKYWMGREYVGFGPGAHSFFGGRRFAFCRDLEEYMAGSATLSESQSITPPEQAREYLLLQMRTLRGIEEWEYRRRFALNFEPIAQKLEEFEQRHWVSLTNRRWHFTPEGFLLSNALLLELLEAQADTLEESTGWQRLLHPGEAPFE